MLAPHKPLGARPYGKPIPTHISQGRVYEFNVWSDYKRIEKLPYMHRNPVARGLVTEPEQ